MSIVAYSADILSGSRNRYACHFYYMAKNDCVYGCYIIEKKKTTSIQVQKVLNLMIAVAFLNVQV